MSRNAKRRHRSRYALTEAATLTFGNRASSSGAIPRPRHREIPAPQLIICESQCVSSQAPNTMAGVPVECGCHPWHLLALDLSHVGQLGTSTPLPIPESVKAGRNQGAVAGSRHKLAHR